MTIIEVSGQSIQLLPSRAAFWIEEQTIIVSDIHLGKASTMQQAGIAVPEGAMDNDLTNVKNLIESTKAMRCIVVGDLIHAPAGLNERVRIKFKAWLASVSCQVVLVGGNHDRALYKGLPEGWNLHFHKDQFLLGPFCFSHFPKKVANFFVWSGHIHPQYLIKSRYDQLTLRCFHLTAIQGILPAFSDFVGGAYVHKVKDSKVYVIADNQVIEV